MMKHLFLFLILFAIACNPEVKIEADHNDSRELAKYEPEDGKVLVFVGQVLRGGRVTVPALLLGVFMLVTLVLAIARFS